jgi:ATP-dependent helicase/nuclease subunit A
MIEPPSVATIDSAALADEKAREDALDVKRSFIVQAPAGSGKTELLTDRFLKLLSVVDEPEQVLAITFTRGATAEMRTRVIDKLLKAKQVSDAGAQETNSEQDLGPAVAALRQSIERGWQLLDQPQRLNIQTIDSLCLSIAHGTPLLARLGGALQPTENARPLYDLAAQRTLQRLGGDDDALNSALGALLTLRDNNLAECERLLAEMLERRDQWAHLFLLGHNVNWELVRAGLESPIEREIVKVLRVAQDLILSDPAIPIELMRLAKYACGNVDADNDLRVLDGLSELPAITPEFVAHWRCLVKLLLTEDNKWRRKLTAAQGFPAGSIEKPRMRDLIARLTEIPGLLDVLCVIDALPEPRYTPAEWVFLRHVFTTLRRAVAELKVVFAEQNVVDFAELGLAASLALGPSEEGGDASFDQALALGERIHHLLVDEFQDTSRRQHQLLTALLKGWDNSDGRTCFLVGDPMQSIYLFRQAEVELFDHVSRHGLNCDGNIVELQTLKLKTNFRSHGGLVSPLNDIFATVFGDSPESVVGFTPSVARKGGATANAVHLHPDILPQGATQEEKKAARQNETDGVLSIVKRHWPIVERALRTPDERFTIGVLVQVRRHAIDIAAALDKAKIPFRAVGLQTLRERQEILDLVALTRALVHPMDRIAWLSVLRAPWCGLQLRDLHELCGTDVSASLYPPMLEPLRTRIDRLSEDGQRRATAVLETMTAALDPRNRLSASTTFATLVERTWYALGGHRCVDATAFENVQTYFSMLDDLDRSRAGWSSQAMNVQLDQLFAQPNPAASERAGVQLMTIHKAKGLGFDVVILPGLERGTGREDQTLIRWLESSVTPGPGLESEDEVLVAPMGEKGAENGHLYKWVQRQKNKRETEERKRLFYVACTRAAQELHLFAAATMTARGLTPGNGTSSLLVTAWPALRAQFEAAAVDSGQAGKTLEPSDLLEFIRPEHKEAAGGQGTMDIAAGAGGDEERPTGPRGLTMRRLPSDLPAEESAVNVTMPVTVVAGLISDGGELQERELFIRPEGSRDARALGTAVHALLERAARSLEHGTAVAELRAAIPGWKRQALAVLRHNGVVGLSPRPSRAEDSAEGLAERAIQATTAAVGDAKGLWILGPHAGALSETSWTGFLDGALRTLRVDRIFRAGAEPLSGGEDCLWIVDYKTARRDMSSDPVEVGEFLKAERLTYERQLESYGRMLRLVKGNSIPIRLGLYYPLLQRLEYWTM